MPTLLTNNGFQGIELYIAYSFAETVLYVLSSFLNYYLHVLIRHFQSCFRYLIYWFYECMRYKFKMKPVSFPSLPTFELFSLTLDG